MKTSIAAVLAFVICLPAVARAASDADVTLRKVEKVVVEKDTITITATEAKSQITLIKEDHDPEDKGPNWHGMPVTVLEVISNRSTFTIKRPHSARPGGPVEKAWVDSLRAANDLKEGRPVGRIGYYAPDIVIKGNMIDSISGEGFLYPGAGSERAEKVAVKAK